MPRILAASRWLLSAFLLAALLAASPTSGIAASLGILVGARTVIIPIPEGFTLLGSETGAWYKAAETTVPPGNISYGMFVPEASLMALYRGTPPDFSRFMQVQVSRTLENKSVSPTAFARLKEQLRWEMEEDDRKSQAERDALALEGEGAVLRHPGTKITPGAEKLDLLGVVMDDDHALGFLQMQRQSANGQGERTALISGMAIVLAGDRAIYLFATTLDGAEESADWVRDALRDWIRKIVAAN